MNRQALRWRLCSAGVVVALAGATLSGTPGTAAEPASGTIRWGGTVAWSGALSGGGGFAGDQIGNEDVCLPGACDDFLLNVDVDPSPDPSLVRFVQMELETENDDNVFMMVFPPGSDPSKDGVHYLRDVARLIDPVPGVWRIQARCYIDCTQAGAYSVTATTGELRVPRAVAHHADAEPAGAAGAARVRLRQVGANTYGPRIAFASDDDTPTGWTVFYQAATVPTVWPIPKVLRSRDGAVSWKNVSPRLGPLYRHPTSQDFDIHVDADTRRVFTVDQVPPCNEISFSDDLGDSWRTTAYCHNAPDPQSLFTGPPVTSRTLGYPNIVYVCARTVTGGNPNLTSCSKSLDGGLAFVPTGKPAFTSAGPPVDDCGFGQAGPGVADIEGAIYVPRGFCGQPWVAISRDEGREWTRVQVADNGIASDRTSIGPETAEEAYRTGVAVDENGTLYYVWSAADRLPYLAISTDGGDTWSDPMMIAAPGVKEAVLPSIDVGAPGRIAVSYMGTEDSPGPAQNYEGVRWNGYITTSRSVLADDPVFFSASVNDSNDPLVVGVCGAFECPDAGHNFDVAIAPDGTPWASFVDVCVEDRCDRFDGQIPSEGVIATIEQEPMRGRHGRQQGG